MKDLWIPIVIVMVLMASKRLKVESINYIYGNNKQTFNFKWI